MEQKLELEERKRKQLQMKHFCKNFREETRNKIAVTKGECIENKTKRYNEGKKNDPSKKNIKDSEEKKVNHGCEYLKTNLFHLLPKGMRCFEGHRPLYLTKL